MLRLSKVLILKAIDLERTGSVHRATVKPLTKVNGGFELLQIF